MDNDEDVHFERFVANIHTCRNVCPEMKTFIQEVFEQKQECQLKLPISKRKYKRLSFMTTINQSRCLVTPLNFIVRCMVYYRNQAEKLTQVTNTLLKYCLDACVHERRKVRYGDDYYTEVIFGWEQFYRCQMYHKLINPLPDIKQQDKDMNLFGALYTVCYNFQSSDHLFFCGTRQHFTELCRKYGSHQTYWYMDQWFQNIAETWGFRLLPPISAAFLMSVDFKQLLDEKYAQQSNRYDAVMPNIIAQSLNYGYVRNYLPRICKPYFYDVLKFMDHKITKFMSILQRKKKTQSTIKKIQVHSKLAYVVDLGQCEFQQLARTTKWRVSFTPSQSSRTFHVVISDQDKTTMSQDHQHFVLFLRYRSVVGQHTHPYLTYQKCFQSYNDQIPRLRYHLLHSDGVFISLTPLLQSTHVVFEHGYDMTSQLGLYKKVKKNYGNNNVLLRIPFQKICLLKKSQLQTFAQHFAHFDYTQRCHFYIMFWNLPVNRQEHYRDPQVKRFGQRCMEVLFQDHNPTTTDYALIQQLISQPSNQKQLNNIPFQCLSLATHPVLVTAMLYFYNAHITSNSLKNLLQCVHFAISQQQPVKAFPIIKLMNQLNLRFQAKWIPIIEIKEKRVLQYILHVPGVHSLWKRVAYYTCMTNNVYIEQPPRIPQPELVATIFKEPPQLVDVPFSFVQIDVPHALVFDRTTMKLVNVKAIRTFAQNPNLNPRCFTLHFCREQGVGVGVYKEVLSTIWTHVKQQSLVVQCQDGYSLTSTQSAYDVHDTFFSLGVISGLCLARHIYLPLPLHIGMWRYVMSMQELTVLQAFPELHQQSVDMMKDISMTDLAEYLQMGQVEFMTYEEIAKQYYLPNLMHLENFRAGFNMFIKPFECKHLMSVMNDMFVLPTSQPVSIESFQANFNRKCEQDDKFLTCVSHMTRKELTLLVKFMTGKTCVPFCHLGEEKLNVTWSDDSFELPKSQTCLHTIILPADQCTSSENIRQFLQPIFEYETVFGFL